MEGGLREKSFQHRSRVFENFGFIGAADESSNKCVASLAPGYTLKECREEDWRLALDESHDGQPPPG